MGSPTQGQPPRYDLLSREDRKDIRRSAQAADPMLGLDGYCRYPEKRVDMARRTTEAFNLLLNSLPEKDRKAFLVEKGTKDFHRHNLMMLQTLGPEGLLGKKTSCASGEGSITGPFQIDIHTLLSSHIAGNIVGRIQKMQALMAEDDPNKKLNITNPKDLARFHNHTLVQVAAFYENIRSRTDRIDAMKGPDGKPLSDQRKRTLAYMAHNIPRLADNVMTHMEKGQYHSLAHNDDVQLKNFMVGNSSLYGSDPAKMTVAAVLEKTEARMTKMANQIGKGYTERFDQNLDGLFALGGIVDQRTKATEGGMVPTSGSAPVGAPPVRAPTKAAPAAPAAR